MVVESRVSQKFSGSTLTFKKWTPEEKSEETVFSVHDAQEDIDFPVNPTEQNRTPRIVFGEAAKERSVRWLSEEVSTEQQPPRVSVMSYNVLARCHAPTAHPNSKRALLTWPWRRERLWAEISAHDATVVTLQDLDDHDWWQRRLSSGGYDVTFKKRTSDDESEEGLEREGVLIGWKRQLLQLCKSEGIDLKLASREHAPSAQLRSRCAVRDDVGLVVMLMPFNDGIYLPSSICVSTFELCGGHMGDAIKPRETDEIELGRKQAEARLAHWREEETVRLAQTRYLASRLECFLADFDVPLVVTGTFYSSPGSDVYELLARGRLSPQSAALALALSPPPPEVLPDKVTLTKNNDAKSRTMRSPASFELNWPPVGGPTVERYHISWRAALVEWTEAITVTEVDATQYKSRIDAKSGRRKTRREPKLRHVVGGLVSGVAYEFRIAAEFADIGLGPWSEPSKATSTEPYFETAKQMMQHRSLISTASKSDIGPIEAFEVTELEDERHNRIRLKEQRFLENIKTTIAPPPRLLLTPSEVHRRRKYGDLSLEACLEISQKKHILSAAEVSSMRLKLRNKETSALEELEMLEALLVKFEAAELSPSVAATDRDVRDAARHDGTKTAIVARFAKARAATAHPYASVSGISPRTNAAHTAATRTQLALAARDVVYPVSRTRIDDDDDEEDFQPEAIRLQLESVYASCNAALHVPDEEDEEEDLISFLTQPLLDIVDAPFTMTAENRVDCVDYIFFSRNGALKLLALLEPPQLEKAPQPPASSHGGGTVITTSVNDEDSLASMDTTSSCCFSQPLQLKEPSIDVRKTSWLPNEIYPSDHICLYAMFEIDPAEVAAIWA